MKTSQLASLALFAPIGQAYVWPSKYDGLDDLLYLQSGYIKDGSLSDQVSTCGFGAGAPGIQKAAEWVRTAFHDSVTHDASAKTGGLDASIRFELDRAENLGAALNNTLSDITSSVNIHNSAADLLALSLVMSVARCANMRVPLRLGRKDAAEAGIKGVPEAHTDLETTRNRFATASLNETDMITLIACGHSIGGVHSVDHPEIVSGPVSADNKLSFDTTKDVLDNNVVLEYLDNSTANPLVINPNNTLNSDKRIFAADDNATMKKLADKAYFKSQCEAAFDKMLSLVPGEVTLTDPLEPADIRPSINSFQLNVDGSINLSGRIRVRVTPSTGRDANKFTAAIIPASRNGSDAAEIVARRATFRGGTSFGYLDEEFQWFEFSQTLNATDRFDSFNIRIDDQIYDNAKTGGYPLNAQVLYQNTQSCITHDSTTDQWTLKVTAAVAKSLRGEPQIRVVHRKFTQGFIIPSLEQEVIAMTRSTKETADYVYYTVSAPLSSRELSTTFDIEVGDSKVEFINTGALTSQLCAPL